MRTGGKNTEFNSYLACFVNNRTLNIYLRIYVIYRVNQAEYGIHILLVALQEYVNIYSTRRMVFLT